MSISPDTTVLVAALVGAAGPLALAHWSRSPADRLRPTLAVALAMATGLAALWGLYQLWPVIQFRISLRLTVFYGALVGLWWLSCYGVLERLLLPLISRLWTAVAST